MKPDDITAPEAQEMLSALSALDKNAAWQVFLAQRTHEMAQIRETVFQATTSDEDATILRRAVIVEERVAPETIIRILRTKYDRILDRFKKEQPQ